MIVLESQQTERLNQLANHLTAAPGTSVGKKSPDDVVIVAAVRTPLTRARKGGFKDTHHEEILAFALKAILDKTKIDPKLIEDVQVGNVLPNGGGATLARMAQLYAGYPDTCSIATVNRQCSSGLQACATIVGEIQTGVIEIGVGAGVESMTMNYGPTAMPSSFSDSVLSHPKAADCLMPMGITSENVAARFKVDRLKQDKFAVSSHQKAALAQKNGWFKEEIVPCKVKVQDKEGNEKTVVLDRDDGIRANTNLETLSKLKPAFKQDGTTTAGNASQVTDGAAAVLFMKRRKAQQLGLPIIGRWVSFAVAGVPPEIMGVGPAFAIPKALEKAKLRVGDVDVYEINEAFASQCVYSVETLKIPFEKVNPKGGAIALGHPLGCTGARQIATLLPELKRQGKKVGVVSMCIGTGMGAAAVIEHSRAAIRTMLTFGMLPSAIKSDCIHIWSGKHSICWHNQGLPFGMSQQMMNQYCSELFATDSIACSLDVLKSRVYVDEDELYTNAYIFNRNTGSISMINTRKISVSTGDILVEVNQTFPPRARLDNVHEQTLRVNANPSLINEWSKIPMPLKSEIFSHNNDNNNNNLMLITYSTRCNTQLNVMLDYAQSIGIKAHVLGLHTFFRGFGWRLKALRSLLKSLPKDQIIMFVDATDTLLLPSCSSDEIVSEFKRLSAPILFMAEKACYPDQELSVKYPQVDTPYRYLNGGGSMGYAWAYLQLFQAFGPINDCDDDQRWWTNVFLSRARLFNGSVITDETHGSKHPGKIFVKLDYGRRVFQSLYDTEAKEFRVDKDRLQTRQTASRPCVFHQNGPKEKVKAINKLSEMMNLNYRI